MANIGAEDDDTAAGMTDGSDEEDTDTNDETTTTSDRTGSVEDKQSDITGDGSTDTQDSSTSSGTETSGTEDRPVSDRPRDYDSDTGSGSGGTSPPDATDSTNDGTTQQTQQQDQTKSFNPNAQDGPSPTGQGVEDMGPAPVGRRQIQDDWTEEDLRREAREGAERLDIPLEELEVYRAGGELVFYEEGTENVEKGLRRVQAEQLENRLIDESTSSEDIAILPVETKEGEKLRAVYTDEAEAERVAQDLRERYNVDPDTIGTSGGNVNINLDRLDAQYTSTAERRAMNASQSRIGPQISPEAAAVAASAEAGTYTPQARAVQMDQEFSEPASIEAQLEAAYGMDLEPGEDYSVRLKQGDKTGVSVDAELTDQGREKVRDQLQQGEQFGDYPIYIPETLGEEGKVVRQRGEVVGYTSEYDVPFGGQRVEELVDAFVDTSREYAEQTGESTFANEADFTEAEAARLAGAATPMVDPDQQEVEINQDSAAKEFGEGVVMAPFALPSYAASVVNLGKEGAEFAGYAAEEAPRDPGQFAGKTGAATVAVGEAVYNQYKENKGKFAGEVVGSLVATSILFKGASAVSSRLGYATRAAIQPGEEAAGIGGYRATRALASERTAQRLFPNQEPLIFSEEAALRYARKGLGRGQDLAERAFRRGRLEAKALEFKAAELRSEDAPRVRANTRDVQRLQQEITSAEFKASEIASDEVPTRTSTDRGMATPLSIGRPTAEVEVESESELESEAEPEVRPIAESEAAAEEEVTEPTVEPTPMETSVSEMDATKVDAIDLVREAERPAVDQGTEMDQGQEMRVEPLVDVERLTERELGVEPGQEVEIGTETEVATEQEIAQEIEQEQEFEQEYELESFFEPPTETEQELEGEPPRIPDDSPGEPLDQLEEFGIEYDNPIANAATVLGLTAFDPSGGDVDPEKIGSDLGGFEEESDPEPDFDAMGGGIDVDKLIDNGGR